MSSRHAAPVLLLTVVAACLPDNPSDTDTTETGAATGTTDDTPTGGPATGLFACDSPPCTLVLVSQTLDDRVDIYDADTRGLRGRIDLDLKRDPTGKQLGVLLDEPYDLALTPTDLLVTLGHYPDTDRGSLLRFPRGDFADLAPGDIFPASRYFNTASLVFDGDVQPLTHARLEGIFLLPHPSGRVLIGVFANDLKSTAENWMNPSEILVFDPEDLDVADLGSFSLGSLDVPCIGGWRLEPLNAEVSKVGVACDGSKSIAVLTLPDDFATASPADAAAGITGCGNSLLGGASTITQFISSDGDGGLLAVQSDLLQAPRLASFRDDCTLVAYSKSPPGELADIKLLRQPVLAKPASDGDPIWLIASALPAALVVARGGGIPELCGRIDLGDAIDPVNAPWALALNGAGDHLAIGTGPLNEPQQGLGTGQVLWGALDRASLDACEPALTDVVDLNKDLFVASDPTTWVRAPNVIRVAELGGDA
jgi:hypothetical protein